MNPAAFFLYKIGFDELKDGALPDSIADQIPPIGLGNAHRVAASALQCVGKCTLMRKISY